MESAEKLEEAPAAERRRKAGTVNWGTATVIGVFAGLLYGGSKEAAASVSKDAEVMLKLGSTPDKREQYRLMRDAMEKRFIRVTKGSIIGGIRLGMFTATFFGIQNLLAEKRGVEDVFNVVGAGSATAATFGLISWLHLKLVEKANEGIPKLEEGSGGVSGAIESLEGFEVGAKHPEVGGIIARGEAGLHLSNQLRCDAQQQGNLVSTSGTPLILMPSRLVLVEVTIAIVNRDADVMGAVRYDNAD
ncbi:hypothetical protein ACLOJK_032549 [Asimina triloba]